MNGSAAAVSVGRMGVLGGGAGLEVGVTSSGVRVGGEGGTGVEVGSRGWGVDVAWGEMTTTEVGLAETLTTVGWGVAASLEPSMERCPSTQARRVAATSTLSTLKARIRAERGAPGAGLGEKG